MALPWRWVASFFIILLLFMSPSVFRLALNWNDIQDLHVEKSQFLGDSAAKKSKASKTSAGIGVDSTAIKAKEAVREDPRIAELAAEVVRLKREIADLKKRGFPEARGSESLNDGKELESPLDAKEASQNGTADARPRIPRQLILTGRFQSLEVLPRDARDNVDRIIKRNPEIQIRWFNDADCLVYLEAHPELGLAQAYKRERRGSYLGDICRIAVLMLEGGFYQDLDVDLKVPFRDLVDESTSFMSVYSGSGGILNALIATEPHGSVVTKTVLELQRWYNKPGSSNGNWMGPETMERGLRDVIKENCPTIRLKDMRSTLQWNCGKDALRMYEERELKSCNPRNLQSPGCTMARAQGFIGLKYALFKPPPSNEVIGWPRYERCSTFGCAIGGWDENSRKGR